MKNWVVVALFLGAGMAKADHRQVSVLVDGMTYQCSGAGSAIRLTPGTFVTKDGAVGYAISNVSYVSDRVSAFMFNGGYPFKCEYVTCKAPGWSDITIIDANNIIFEGRDFLRKVN